MKNSVTVLVPVLNEEKYIRSFLHSLLRQDYPRDRMEVLFLDGGCRDASIRYIEESLGKGNRPVKGGLRYRILKNRGRTAPCAMNLGIAEAAGEIIVRMDVHNVYPADYISRCLHYLITTDADNVGCPRLQQGKGLIGECIAASVTSAFGVGGSSFRKGNEFYSDTEKTEYVDTVPLGTFKRELARRLGGFDERYPRAEDNDFNYRIRKAGGKVLLFKDIHTVYYCRSSVCDLIRMGFGNGASVGSVFWKDPGTVSVRHFVPFGFVVSLAGGAILSKKSLMIRSLLRAEMLIYTLSCTAAAIHSRKNALKTLLIIPMFPALHISYGIGTAAGLVRGWKDKAMGKRHDRR